MLAPRAGDASLVLAPELGGSMLACHSVIGM
jgi:hypothetical protein